jgi:hypothetical protein
MFFDRGLVSPAWCHFLLASTGTLAATVTMRGQLVTCGNFVDLHGGVNTNQRGMPFEEER